MPTTKQKEEHWYSLSVADCFKKLKSTKSGLSTKQALIRKKSYGSNIIPSEKPLSGFIILLNQIKSPLVYVLIVAGVVSVFLRHFTDAGVIFFTVIVNTIFGFWQENKANNAIAQLKKIVKQKARVLRDGGEVEIDSSDLVPGDVIFLEAGDKVPADCRIFESKDLQATEAALTGESSPSSKNNKTIKIGTSLADRENMAFMGTLIVRGKALAIVCNIGIKTEIGEITKLIKETKEEKTPLQDQLSVFSKWLTLLIVILSLLVFIVGIFLGKEPVEMFITAVALSVAAIPSGLVVSITIVLTLGMQFILKRKALVRKLVAAETLGSTSIICTDKTGTLTEGKMRFFKMITADKEYEDTKKIKDMSKVEKVRDLISKISILCSSAVIENPEEVFEKIKIIGGPTEKALLMTAIEIGYDQERLNKDYQKIDEVPFDSEKKFMATLHDHKSEDHKHIFMKGAPEVVFKYCTKVMINGKAEKLTTNKLDQLRKKYENYTSKGLRVLAFAYKTGKNFEKCDDELNELVFLGFIALKDPLRLDTKETLLLCKKAGIRPIVITGDHRLTAKAIFEELGLKVDGNIVEGKELDNWSDEELQKKVENIDIYARVEPRHKLRIVSAWQKKGEVVAMTGDGINDAPAVKVADIGIALGDGSDVTKETADMILLDNKFSVIVAAVEQGRIIFENIRKIILYLLSDSFSEIILIFGGLVLGLPLPILATQILWINLIADGLPSIALAMEPGEPEIMKDMPRKKNEKILNKEMKILIFIIGIVTDVVLLGTFIFLLKYFGYLGLDHIRTIIFMALGIDSLLFVFSVRSLRHSIFTKNPFGNKYLIAAVLVSFFVLISAIYVPLFRIMFKTVILSLVEWGLVLSLAVVKISLIESVKYYFIVKNKKNQRIKVKQKN